MSTPPPALSVVIGSNGSPGSVERCLAALEPQRDRSEVIVCEPQASPAAVRERFGWATWLELPGALVPELWREGIDRAPRADRGADDLSDGAGRRLAGDAARRARPARRRRRRDRPGQAPASCRLGGVLLRYAKDMRPFEPHATVDLPGDNASYKRELLGHARPVPRRVLGAGRAPAAGRGGRRALAVAAARRPPGALGRRACLRLPARAPRARARAPARRALLAPAQSRRRARGPARPGSARAARAADGVRARPSPRPGFALAAVDPVVRRRLGHGRGARAPRRAARGPRSPPSRHASRAPN